MADESPDPREGTTDGGVPTGEAARESRPMGLPRWVTALLPLVLLAAVLGAFVLTSPLAGVESGEPLPDVSVTHATIPNDNTLVLHVTNNGPEAVTIAQLLVDEAYWSFALEGAGGDRTLQPMGSAQVVVPYHWQPGWDLEVALLLSDGTTVDHTIVAPQATPGSSLGLLGTLALIGLFVGVVPVALGMLWFPYIRSMSDRALQAVLSFSEGAEDAQRDQRRPLVGALLLVQAASAWREERAAAGGARASSGLWVAYLVAVGIGLHNLAEGLAIGSSFALGRVSLGAFLVVGFMLHNVTEGPAVVAPFAREERPAIRHFLALGLIAGAPVILGGWIGSLAFSPTLGAFFLAVGVGAILQVDWEILGMVRGAGGRAGSATNLLAFLLGFALMYATDLIVAL